jgi:pyruvate/2-oxoacid:ferredoxin oxidoreductase beta subunit
MYTCSYCNKICKNKNSHINHERCCPSNPNRNYRSNKLGKKGGNQYTKGTARPISDETRRKLSEAGKKQKWTDERKRKLSESMKKAVEKYPESYTSSNRGRTKQVIVDGIKFQGQWELEFYNYCIANNIKIERSNEWFEYEWNGTRKYFPDFYLPEKNTYVEVKGYETDRDKAKWKYFPKKLKVIKKEEIKKIRKGCFVDL